MKISSKTSVIATLRRSEEKNVHVYGLCSTAWYAIDLNPFFMYKVVFWNRHAPVTMNADIVSINLEGIYAYTDGCGHIKRDKNGCAMVTRQFVLLCPKTREGLYMQGYDPLTLAKSYVNRYMMPTTWLNDDYFVKQV